jgi:hypothetical protein
VGVAEQRRGRSAERAEVNRNVRMAVKRFDVPGIDEESWDFLCECGLDDCTEWVALTLTEYEALLQAEKPILAPGHEVTRAEWARRKARRLADDAQALRAQSDVQQKRAGRNLEQGE